MTSMVHWVAQVVPQVPQLAGSLVRFFSQPSVALLLQSAKPVLHAMAHAPLTQLDPAFAAAQTLPQIPQLAVSFVRFFSQPSAGLVLQSAKPELQVPTWH